MTTDASVTIPDFVDYPEFYSVKDNHHFFDCIFGYVIEPYPNEGYNLFIGIRGEHILMRVADFESNSIDLNEADENLKKILEWSTAIIEMQATIKVIDASYYFACGKDGPVLVDVMLAANKFMGPGMLRDVYAKQFPTQNVIDICRLDSDNRGKYKGNLIKPSRFRYLDKDNRPTPQYGIID